MAKGKSSSKSKEAVAKVSLSPDVKSHAPEDRRRMIAEAAYFRAQARGFQGGDPLDDWLAAEAEVDQMLPSPKTQ